MSLSEMGLGGSSKTVMLKLAIIVGEGWQSCLCPKAAWPLSAPRTQAISAESQSPLFLCRWFGPNHSFIIYTSDHLPCISGIPPLPCPHRPLHHHPRWSHPQAPSALPALKPAPPGLPTLRQKGLTDMPRS